MIFAGAILGVTAALLWSAQGCIMMSYPLEKDKGKSFGVFWAIFQFGSFIGAIIALAINLRQGHLDAVATSTYIVNSLFSKVLNLRLISFSSPHLVIGFLSYHLFRHCLCLYGIAPTPSRPGRWNYRKTRRPVLRFPGVQGSVGASQGLAHPRYVLV